ncbi:MAG TPA: multicopper oxidase family protein [Actinomycetota bacterium]|nr:multicopper oxidase family protein [Actinomycetota bacterium]
MAEAKAPAPPAGTIVGGVLLLVGAVLAAIWLAGGSDREPSAGPSPDGPTPPGTDPCAFQEIDPAVYGHEELVNPPEISAEGKVLRTKLRVAYTKRSKTEIAGCPVKLRTYNRKLVGPTLRLRPGQTLDLALINDLPRETRKQVKAQFAQESDNAYLGTTPHSFNTTNLHTHGLHVSPRGNGDNVLLAVRPQKTQRYHIPIPRDHAPGTFWYHAHGHGSTAIQVGSGMAGTILIEDGNDIPPALAEANEREKVMLFGSILYDTTGQANDITAFFPDPPPPSIPCERGLSSCTWQSSHRRTTINGQIVPRIFMQPGEVQRWRMIDGTFRETLEIRLDGHSLHEIALDGLYLGGVDTWAPDQPIELQPGYRSDVLVKASMEEGTYLLRDGPTPKDEALRGVAEDEEILAEVVVRGDPMDMELPTDEEMSALEPFPGVDLSKEATGVQVASFKIGSDAVASGRNYFHVNFQAFDPKHVRRLELGAVDEWSLSTTGDPAGVPGPEAPPGSDPIPPLDHIFHIHVNPFQMERTGPDGKEELVWKDTLLVPSTASPQKPLPVYTKYTDFTGKFVIHCHILDHEDLGMMEAIKVVRPGSLIDKPKPEHH